MLHHSAGRVVAPPSVVRALDPPSTITRRAEGLELLDRVEDDSRDALLWTRNDHRCAVAPYWADSSRVHRVTPHEGHPVTSTNVMGLTRHRRRNRAGYLALLRSRQRPGQPLPNAPARPPHPPRPSPN